MHLSHPPDGLRRRHLLGVAASAVLPVVVPAWARPASAAAPSFTLKPLTPDGGWTARISSMAGEYIGGFAQRQEPNHWQTIALLSNHRRLLDRRAFGGRHNVINGVNASGTLVGRGAAKGRSGTFAMQLRRHAPAQLLQDPADAQFSEATAINAEGAIVGFYRPHGASFTFGFRWLDGHWVTLPGLTADGGCVPQDINASGEVVGQSLALQRDGSLIARAFHIDAQGIRELPAGPGLTIGAVAVADSGWIAGYEHLPHSYRRRPARWLRDQIEYLPTPAGSESSWATDVHPEGTVIGIADFPTDADHPDVPTTRGWLCRGGQTWLLDDLVPGLPPHTRIVEATALDAAGRVGVRLARRLAGEAAGHWTYVAGVLYPL